MKDIRFVKLVVFVNALVPLALLVWDAWNRQLGANPVNFAIRTTGMLALVFLTLSLTVTPLRKLSGQPWLFHARRPLGLFAFFYAVSHFLLFFALDRGLDVADTLSEMVKRPYLVVGSLGLLVMVPLAATSFNAMIKRLGARRWKALHRLAYVAAAAGVLHYYMLVKADVRKPIAFAIAVGILLGYRLVASIFENKTASALAEKKARWTGKLRVDRVVEETPDVRTVRLVSENNGPLPFAYLPGQYLPIVLQIAGKPVYRTYTIASSPTNADFCELTIKREPQGVASGYVHGTLRPGDLVQVSSPGGRFTFDGNSATGVTLIGAGVGITPLMSMIRYLTEKPWGGQIYLIYSCRDETGIVFSHELADLQKRNTNLHVTITLTRPLTTSWQGSAGRISSELLTRAVPNLPALPVYICGPAAMMQATRNLLLQLAVPDANIHIESFGTPAAAVAEDAFLTDVPRTVAFARSKKSAPVTRRDSLLEVAESAGISVDFECRSGICGRCRCPLLSGSVTMATQEALTPADRQNNIILLCQARATSDVVIDA